MCPLMFHEQLMVLLSQRDCRADWHMPALTTQKPESTTQGEAAAYSVARIPAAMPLMDTSRTPQCARNSSARPQSTSPNQPLKERALSIQRCACQRTQQQHKATAHNNKSITQGKSAIGRVLRKPMDATAAQGHGAQGQTNP